jgi:hypothetical protein
LGGRAKGPHHHLEIGGAEDSKRLARQRRQAIEVCAVKERAVVKDVITASAAKAVS